MMNSRKVPSCPQQSSTQSLNHHSHNYQQHQSSRRRVKTLLFLSIILLSICGVCTVIYLSFNMLALSSNTNGESLNQSHNSPNKRDYALARNLTSRILINKGENDIISGETSLSNLAKSKAMPTMKPPSQSTSVLMNKESKISTFDTIQREHTDYQIVFSTGCSLYQDWQSYLFFHHAWSMNQTGTITRIVSGCDNDEQEKKVQDIFRREIQESMLRPKGEKIMNDASSGNINSNFQIHFTPNYSRLKPKTNYVYFNKPYGMKHWMEHKLGFPDNPINKNAIIVLMDPDQLIMRPFQDNNFTNTQWKFIPPKVEPRTKIDHGKPMGQLYGFGNQWKTKINMTELLLQVYRNSGKESSSSHTTPSKTMTTLMQQLTSPVDKLSFQEAQAGYIVGPPYIATANDMYNIVSKWSEFVVPTHDQYPHLLAEMFAYCLAAAHLKLPHQTAVSFMISDVDTGVNSEGWKKIDDMPLENVCTKRYDIEDLPNVLHYCQRYGVDKYFFGKRKLQKDILSCESPLLQEVPSVEVLDDIKYALFPNNEKRLFNDQKTLKRNAFVICYILPAINAAATHFKNTHCNSSDITSPKPNYNKQLLVSHMS